YKFDAVDAYNDGKVKKIEVASVTVRNEVSDGAFVHLQSVQNRKGISAKLLLDIKGNNGKVKRQVKEVKQGKDLYELSKLDPYYGYFVSEINAEHGYVEFSNGKLLRIGQTLGGMDDRSLKRKLIAKTIQEHLDKEIRLNPKGIKVLSLFFIDTVAKYRQYDEEGNHILGEYAQLFEEEYEKLINREKYRSIFDEIRDKEVAVSDVHKGYFSSDKKAKASNSKEKYEYFKDTSGSVKAD